MIGIVTDGDLRRAFASNISFKLPIDRIMTKEPISIHYLTPKEPVISNIKDKILKIKKEMQLSTTCYIS